MAGPRGIEPLTYGYLYYGHLRVRRSNLAELRALCAIAILHILHEFIKLT